jgi:hypothetical protein
MIPIERVASVVLWLAALLPSGGQTAAAAPQCDAWALDSCLRAAAALPGCAGQKERVACLAKSGCLTRAYTSNCRGGGGPCDQAACR